MEDLRPDESMENDRMKLPPTVLPTSQPEECIKHERSPTTVGLPRDVSFAGPYRTARPIQLGKRGNRSWRRDGLARRSNEQGQVQRSESSNMSPYSQSSSAQQDSEQVYQEQAGTSQDKMSSVAPRKPPLPKRSPSTVQIPSSQSISSSSVTPMPSSRIHQQPQRDGSPQILPPGSTPPLKRRKLDHPLGNAQARDTPQLTSVKDEGGTASSAPTRRLVKESCQFYPLPDNCKKSHPDYKQNRQAFLRHEYAKLLNLGLKKRKVIMRDDGMVIEWTSSIPVWSDTLQPMNLATVITQTLQNNANQPVPRSRTRTPSSSSARSGSGSLPAAPPLQAESLTQKPDSALVPSVRRLPPARPSSVKTEPEQRPSLLSSSQSLSSVSPFPASSQTSVTSVASVGGELEPLFSRTSESPFSAIKIESTDVKIKSEDTMPSQTPFLPSQPQYQSSSPQKIPLPRRRRLPMPKPVTIPAPKGGPIQIQTEPKKEPDILTSLQPISAPSESSLAHSQPDPHNARHSPADLQRKPESEFTRNFESDMVDSQDALGSLAVSANAKPEPSIPDLPPGIPTLQSSSLGLQPCPSNPPPLQLNSQSGQSASQHGQRSSVGQASPAVAPSSTLLVSECAVQNTRTVEPPAPNTSLTSGPASVVKPRAWSAGELSEVKPMALDFLRRYIQAFDADRASLRNAYAKESTFSYQIHTSSTESGGTSSTTRFKPSIAHAFVPQSSSATTKTVFQGPEQIVKAITGFGPFKFCPRNSPSKVHYDVASLHDTAGGGILLMAYGEVVREKVTKVFFQKEDVLSVDFSFVLHRKEDSSSCQDESTWPLVSVAHQMTVRDVNLAENAILLPSDFEKQFPWLNGTN